MLFVDVRYPRDYESEHLPGAVNIPVRKLRTPELEAALTALPRRPIVVPCYDKRSSFYGLILGLRVSRLGYDFRGRYTLPHEFAVPAQEKAWVARWQAELAERTLFGSVRKLVRESIEKVASWSGSLPLAIVLAALLLRLLMLPLAWKAERDTLVQRRLAPRLGELRGRLLGDRVRLQRASMAMLRDAGVTPVRNLFGSVLILVAFTLLFTAIDRASAMSAATVLWAPIADPDPSYVLPAIATALLAGIVGMQCGRRPVGRWFGLLFVLGIGWLVTVCRAGVQLYLIVSFAAVLVQNVAVRVRMREARQQRPPRLPRGIVPLSQAAGHAELGGKAHRLGDLIVAGYDVPDGFVVPHGHEPTAAELDRAFARLGAARVAVRSSAVGEDGEHQSFAGEFRTLLDVERAGLPAAIAAVRRSYAGRPGGVVVQAMVPAEFAGVMFTEDPAHSGRLLIEAVEGLGEGLVSGTATPTEHRVGRITGAVAEGDPAPFDLSRLVTLGRDLEARFGAPQDVEWAMARGRMLLLQSRHVTRRAGDGDDPVAIRERERARLLALAGDAPAEEPLFVASDYAALLPEPTPFSLAVMKEIWAPGGSVDLACRRLGLRFDAPEDGRPYLQSVFGRCFVDARAAATRVQSTAAAGFRLGVLSPRLEAALTDGFLPEHRRAARLRDAIDLGRLSTAELHDLCEVTRRRFVRETYVECEVVNLAAEAYFAAARRRLERLGLDPSGVLGHGVRTVVQDAFAQLRAGTTAAVREASFMAAFGHRAPHDFELAEPRFRETPETVAAMSSVGHDGVAATATAAAPELKGRVLRVDVQRARRFQELKEEAKHAAMLDLAFLRHLLLALGERYGLGDLVFHLTPEEVVRLQEPEFAAAAEYHARTRQRHLGWLRAVRVPDSLTPAMLETVGEQKALPALGPHGLRGTCVAGDHDVVGKVRVLHSPTDLASLGRGDILVVRNTDPCWLPAFRIAGGLVSEVGGWLSHAAIQAREHNLPAIVGLADATASLRDGQRVRLRRDGRVEFLEEAG
ncbi:MAG: PEP/pyruvate-binding domain-containing protein [Planctomycetota bacterium]